MPSLPLVFRLFFRLFFGSIAGRFRSVSCEFRRGVCGVRSRLLVPEVLVWVCRGPAGSVRFLAAGQRAAGLSLLFTGLLFTGLLPVRLLFAGLLLAGLLFAGLLLAGLPFAGLPLVRLPLFGLFSRLRLAGLVRITGSAAVVQVRLERVLSGHRSSVGAVCVSTLPETRGFPF